MHGRVTVVSAQETHFKPGPHSWKNELLCVYKVMAVEDRQACASFFFFEYAVVLLLSHDFHTRR